MNSNCAFSAVILMGRQKYQHYILDIIYFFSLNILNALNNLLFTFQYFATVSKQANTYFTVLKLEKSKNQQMKATSNS